MVGKDLLHRTQKALSIKEKLNTVDYIHIRNFCSSRDSSKRAKRQATQWEKGSMTQTAIHIIYKLLQFKKKKKY